MSRYIIRNYQPADFDDYVRLRQEAERLEPGGRHISAQTLAEALSRPGYSPRDDLLLVSGAGSLVGYMDMVPEMGIGRVILNCWLLPEHRRKGLATRLLGHAMDRARESGIGVAHVNVTEDNAVATTVLYQAGV